MTESAVDVRSYALLADGATLLLEHLVSFARSHGVTCFTAETLAENTAMLRVFADAGLSATHQMADGVVELTMPVPRGVALSEARDLDALRDTLLRISRLADDLPQVAELDLNPVIARPDGVVAVDARIRVTSHGSADPFLRQLRSAPRPQS